MRERERERSGDENHAKNVKSVFFIAFAAESSYSTRIDSREVDGELRGRERNIKESTGQVDMDL